MDGLFDRSRRKDKYAVLFAACIVLAVYAVSLAILPKHVFWMPDEGAKYMQLNALHWAGDVRYDVPFPARRIDARFEFLPQPDIFPKPSIASDGNMYIGFETPVVFPLLTRVPLRWFGLSGLYLIPLLSSCGIALLSGLMVARLASPPWAAATVLLVGIATPIWFYGMVFWEHTFGCLLAFLAVAFATLAPGRQVAAAFAAVIALAAAAVMRMEMVAVALALLLAWGIAAFAARLPSPAQPAASRLPRSAYLRWGFYLALGLGAAATLLILNASLTLRHRKMLSIVPMQLGSAAMRVFGAPHSFLEVLVNSTISEGPKISDLLAVGVLLAIIACGAAAFVRSRRAELALLAVGSSGLFAFSMYLTFTEQSYRSLHGFFPVAPFLALWPYALRRAWHERQHTLLLLTSFAILDLLIGIVAIAVNYIWNGRLEVGMEWGQRYLLILYPVLAVATVAGVYNHWQSTRPPAVKRTLMIAMALMALVSVELELRGLGMLYSTRQHLASWEAALRSEGPIVTDVWWLPSALAVLYTEHEMFFVSARDRTARWTELAASHGVERFTFASLEPVTLSDTPRVRQQSQRVVDGLYLTSFTLTADSARP